MMQAPSINPGLSALDLAIMILYFMSMVAIGLLFARKSKTTEAYFLGTRNTPSWTLALSMIAAKISSVTFLAIPAAVYALDCRLFTRNLAIIPVALICVWLLAPFYRRAVQTTAFEYLHQRFGTGARLYAAIVTLLTTALKIGSVIYLVSIPLSMFTGISSLWVMIIVGSFCTFYTLIGGLQAVIWTDAIQAIILHLGGIAVLAVILTGIPGGFSTLVSVASDNDKFSLGPMSWALGDRNFWAILVAGIFVWIATYTSDQVLIQRYLASKNLCQARMAGWASSFLCLPTWGFFFFLGAALYVYYKFQHDPFVASLPSDSILPHFILTQMPSGLSGLVIAGITSSAMGSLSASLNVFSTVATVDVVKPYLLKGKSDRFYTGIAKLLTGLAAVIMFSIAYAFSIAEKESFLDLFYRINGLLGGMIPALFLLGLFATRVNNRILWQAFPLALVFNIYLVLVELNILPEIFGLKIHPYWVSAWVMIVMILTALILSKIQKTPPDSRTGLIVFSKKQDLSTNQSIIL